MVFEIKRRKWLQPRIKAHIWFCGDEVCDCHQPQITLLLPNYKGGCPWLLLYNLWEGTYMSEPWDGWGTLVAEIEEAAARYDIPLDEDHWGIRDVTSEELPIFLEAVRANGGGDDLDRRFFLKRNVANGTD